MSNVIPLLGTRAPETDHLTIFSLARRDMFNAYRDWLATTPDPVDIQDEIDATTSVLRQLRDLAGAA